MTSEEAGQFVERVAEHLGEHFDAVQILVSRSRPAGGGTEGIRRGCGNWYARQGMAQEFISIDRAIDQANEIARAITPPPPDGDEWRNADAG